FRAISGLMQRSKRDGCLKGSAEGHYLPANLLIARSEGRRAPQANTVTRSGARKEHATGFRTAYRVRYPHRCPRMAFTVLRRSGRMAVKSSPVALVST